MTISKAAIYGTDRDQVLQDLYSNIDVLSRFVRDVKSRTLADSLQFDKLHVDDRERLLDLLIAENAVASITSLVTAEINGGYNYAWAVEDDAQEAKRCDEDEVKPSTGVRQHDRGRALDR